MKLTNILCQIGTISYFYQLRAVANEFNSQSIRIMKRNNGESKLDSSDRSLLSMFELLTPKHTIIGSPEFIQAPPQLSDNDSSDENSYNRCIRGIQLTLDQPDFFKLNFEDYVDFIRVYTNEKFGKTTSGTRFSLPLPLVLVFNNSACECGEKLFEVPNCCVRNKAKITLFTEMEKKEFCSRVDEALLM